VEGSPVIVCGNSTYTIGFNFDAEWPTGTKTARFVYVQDGEVKYQDVVFTGVTVAVPILAGVKEVRVGVYAGNLQTSTPAVIPCEYSIRCGTGAPADPTPSQYDQIIALLQRNNTAIAGLDLNGVNLLQNSRFALNFDKWAFTYNTASEITTLDGVPCAHFTGALGQSTALRQSVLEHVAPNSLDQTYILSADIRLDNYVAGTTNPFVRLYFSGTYDNGGTAANLNATTVSGNPDCAPYNNSGWVRMSWVVKFTQVPTSLYAFIYARDFTGDLYFKNLKLEKSSHTTGWAPAPEDFTALESRLAALEASLLAIGGET
jgi:hypothetical protein